MKIPEFIQEASSHPDLGQVAAVTSNESKCLMMGVFGNDTDEQLTAPDIIDILEIMNDGDKTPLVNRAMWHGVIIQAANSGVLERTEGSSRVDDHHKYSLTEWGRNVVRPFAGHVIRLSLNTSEGVRQLIGEPRIPRNGETPQRFFGKMGLLACGLFAPVTFETANQVLVEAGLSTRSQITDTIRSYTLHPYVKEAKSGGSVVSPAKHPDVKGYNDILLQFLDNSGGEEFNNVGISQLELAVSDPTMVQLLEEHATVASNNVDGRRVTNYEELGGIIHSRLVSGDTVPAAALSSMFPALTKMQVERLKRKIRNGDIKGVTFEGSQKSRYLVLSN